MARLAEVPGAEFAYEFPSLAIRFEHSTNPVKRVWRDFGEAPTSRCAVGTRSDLHDLVANFPTGLALLVAAYWIDPADAPGLNCRIPNAQGGPVHVVLMNAVRLAIGRTWQDPISRAIGEQWPTTSLPSTPVQYRYRLTQRSRSK